MKEDPCPHTNLKSRYFTPNTSLRHQFTLDTGLMRLYSEAEGCPPPPFAVTPAAPFLWVGEGNIPPVPRLGDDLLVEAQDREAHWGPPVGAGARRSAPAEGPGNPGGKRRARCGGRGGSWRPLSDNLSFVCFLKSGRPEFLPDSVGFTQEGGAPIPLTPGPG